MKCEELLNDCCFVVNIFFHRYYLDGSALDVFISLYCLRFEIKQCGAKKRKKEREEGREGGRKEGRKAGRREGRKENMEGILGQEMCLCRGHLV